MPNETEVSKTETEVSIELDAKELAKELEIIKQKYAKLESDNIRKEKHLNEKTEQLKMLDKQKAEETGNFKQLYESESQEKIRLDAEKKALAEKLAILEQEKEELRLEKVKKLPKDMQDSFSNLTIPQIEKLLETLGTQRNSQGIINSTSIEPNPNAGHPLLDPQAREKALNSNSFFKIG